MKPSPLSLTTFFLSLALLTLTLPTPTHAQTSYTITRSVASPFDDAEQTTTGGTTDRGSSRLDLGESSSGDPFIVGVRFTYLTIPAGATITDARIQFTSAAAPATDPSTLTIAAHDTGNSKTFTDRNSTNVILTGRTPTSTTATWTPPGWDTNSLNGPDQQTPNLAPVMQSIINRADWEAGNAVSFLITGTGRRSARSFDNNAYNNLGGEPVLTLTYQTDNQPPEVTLTSPTQDGIVTEGTVAMTADAIDPDGSIDRVEFLIDEQVVGTDTTAPYSVDVSGVEVYQHKAIARAIDNQGLAARSPEIDFKIRPPVPAFPEAEGFGAYAKGGRGGRVIYITNLNDSGPGSLRACLDATGPRYCLFRVAGNINSNDIRIEDRGSEFVTIAGQTAPGDGVTIKGTFRVRKTHDAIIRHIRLRNEGEQENEDCLGFGKSSWNAIVDHVSCSWSTDEGLSSGGEGTHLGDFTIQRSIAAEGLLSHSFGGLISDSFGTSFHHNLIANNNARNTKMIGHTSANATLPVVNDFVNNIIYNWGAYASHCAGNAQCNLVNNYYLPGPNYDERRPELIRDEERPPLAMYMTGNYGPTCPQGCDIQPECDPTNPDNVARRNPDPSRPAVNVGTHDTMCMAGKWNFGDQYCEWWGDQSVCNWSYSDTRINAPQVTTQDTPQVIQNVLADVGANQGLNADGTFFTRQDAVDERLINAVQSCYQQLETANFNYDNFDYNSCIGQHINSPADVGGFPSLDPGTPYEDTDLDGMADEWETNHFGDLSRGDPNDSSGDFDGDGYTDLEEFLNGTDPTVAEFEPPPNNTPGDYEPPDAPDGDVDINDFWHVITNFIQQAYTIFDFNQVISNFGN